MSTRQKMPDASTESGLLLEHCVPPDPMERGILSAIGKTPLVRLNRVLGQCLFSLYAKLEGSNPGGSAKDRAALYIIERAIAQGLIHKNTTVVESSSGNMAIGLAQVCLYYGLKFISVVDAKTNEQNLELLRLFGATVDVVAKPDPKTGEYLPARLARVQDIRQSLPSTYWPNQYANMDNADAHFLTTMPEISSSLGRQPDF